MQAPRRYEASDFPTVDRTLKGDRLALHTPNPTMSGEQPANGRFARRQHLGARRQNGDGAYRPTRAPLDPELAKRCRRRRCSSMMRRSIRNRSSIPGLTPDTAVIAVVPAPPKDGFSVKTASLFFGGSSLGAAGK